MTAKAQELGETVGSCFEVREEAIGSGRVLYQDFIEQSYVQAGSIRNQYITSRGRHLVGFNLSSHYV